MSAPLTKQTKNVCAIVDFMEGYNPIPSERIKELIQPLVLWLGTECDMYSLILHDLDEREDNNKKVPHVHVCFILKKRKRLSQCLTSIARCCSVGPLAVTIDQLGSFDGYTQYLIHKNDPDKYQYPVDGIVTNLSRDELQLVLESKTKAIELSDIVAFIKEGHDVLETMEYCGLSVYQHYRASIQDIYKALEHERLHKKSLADENALLRHEVSNIYVGLNDLMQSKDALLRGYVPLRELQDVLDAVQNIKHDFAIGKENDTLW